MDDRTAPIPPVPPSQPLQPEPPRSRGRRLGASRVGLPLAVGAGGLVAGVVLAGGVAAVSGDDDTVDARFAGQGTMPGSSGLAGPEGGRGDGFDLDGDGDGPGMMGGPGMMHGPGMRGGAGGDETPLTGTTADKVKKAVLATYPDAQIMRLEQEEDGAYEAHVVVDGSMLDIHLDEDFSITDTDEREMGRMPGMHGPGDDDSDDDSGTSPGTTSGTTT